MLTWIKLGASWTEKYFLTFGMRAWFGPLVLFSMLKMREDLLFLQKVSLLFLRKRVITSPPPYF